jgi:predicted MFS family arabinose efflux permease
LAPNIDQPVAERPGNSVLVLVCVLTFVHYTSAQMRTLILPLTRGLVMGGYSTSMYLGLALGSFALGPVITGHGYPVGFAVGEAPA